MIDLTFLKENFRKAIFDSIPENVSPECLDFDVKNKIAILKLEKGFLILGCELCLTNKIEQDYRGDLFIGSRKLKNGREKPELLSLPNEVLNNFWMCPHCEKPFKERMIKL
jgi:hypothetical protein